MLASQCGKQGAVVTTTPSAPSPSLPSGIPASAIFPPDLVHKLSLLKDTILSPTGCRLLSGFPCQLIQLRPLWEGHRSHDWPAILPHGGPVPSTPVTLPPLPLGSWCLCALVCLSEQQFSKAQYVVRLSGCISELKTKTKKNPNPLLVFILLHFLEYSFFLHLLPDNLVPSSWGFI